MWRPANYFTKVSKAAEVGALLVVATAKQKTKATREKFIVVSVAAPESHGPSTFHRWPQRPRPKPPSFQTGQFTASPLPLQFQFQARPELRFQESDTLDSPVFSNSLVLLENLQRFWFIDLICKLNIFVTNHQNYFYFPRTSLSKIIIYFYSFMLSSFIS